jgi:hypothetical protein
MNRIGSMLQERFKQETKPTNKMAQLVQRSHEGNPAGFEGMLSSYTLSDEEKDGLHELLARYSDHEPKSQDLQQLCQLTVEVKAITKQALLLHGERIKRAQALLKNYKEGAFSSWLIRTYGNRQTPYNLLLYYELHLQLPQETKNKLDLLPKQAVYTLASREGSLETKVRLIESYKGESKEEMLQLIRNRFPLKSEDKRIGKHPALGQLYRLQQLLNNAATPSFSEEEMLEAQKILKTCQKLLSLHQERT